MVEAPSARSTGGGAMASERLVRKSSPGKGGPELGPEKGAAKSAPLASRKRPVVSGVPWVTPQPS